MEEHCSDRLENSPCICAEAGRIVLGFTIAAVALAQCKFDTSELRFWSDALMGWHFSPWYQGCLTSLLGNVDSSGTSEEQGLLDFHF